jgi:S-adenosylmethionine-diacylgycerolhomoserine-N-methlytransferase
VALLETAPLVEHAQRMDAMYRYQRHIYDLTRKYYLLGRDRAIDGLALAPGQTLLEIGCGTGRNLALAYRHYPQARLFGLDISAEMLVSARSNLRAVAEKPVLQVADATDFTAADFGQSGFDRILVSYALSMIPEWERAIDSALAALAPGGSLHVVDFGQQEHLPRWFGRMLKSWLARFHVTPRANLREALERRAEACGAQLTFHEVGRGYAWLAVIRQHG